MIRVFIERYCKGGKEQALVSLLKDLRACSLRQSGYVSGETLIGVDDPALFLVVSTWTHLNAWKAWEDSQPRLELTNLMAPLLIGEPRIHIYRIAEE